MKHTLSGLVRLMICGIAGALALLPLTMHAQPVPEYDLKAAFVYNFTLFTEWPVDTIYESGTLNICVHPASAQHQSLAALGGRAIKGRKLAVRHLTIADGVRGCHVLFMDSGERDRWTRIRQGFAGISVLTIADDEELGREGSVITLAMDGNRIVFDVNLEAARQAQLVLSSKLLRLARKVR